MRNFPGPFRSPQMLKYKKNTLPLLTTPVLSRSLSLPLEVGPFKST